MAMTIADRHLGLQGAQLVTVTFLTLAFSQLWHVFNLRHQDSGILRNEVTRSVWVWVALVFCSALLCLAVYLPQLRFVLGLARPDGQMWFVAIMASLAPLALIQLAKPLAHLVQRAAK